MSRVLYFSGIEIDRDLMGERAQSQAYCRNHEWRGTVGDLLDRLRRARRASPGARPMTDLSQHREVDERSSNSVKFCADECRGEARRATFRASEQRKRARRTARGEAA